ncbi:MAG: CHAT domain-containing protein, partial [Qipengyuania sp.]
MRSKTWTAIAACSAAAVMLSAPLQPVAAQNGERPVSYSDTFPIGANGLCEAQIMPPQPGAGLFDRGYTIVCRDAAAPVGSLWVLRDAQSADASARFLPSAECREGGETAVPDALGDSESYSCSDSDLGTRRILVAGEVGGRLYAGEAIA